MRHFFRVANNINVLPTMLTLARHPNIWSWTPEDLLCSPEFKKASPSAVVSSLFLRCYDGGDDHREAIDTSAMYTLEARSTILDIMRLVGGSRLGRVAITMLKPGGKMVPEDERHLDCKTYYTRYHLVLQALPGAVFNCGDDNMEPETISMATGELWWINSNMQHSVINNSQDDRVHMMMDFRTDDYISN